MDNSIPLHRSYIIDVTSNIKEFILLVGTQEKGLQHWVSNNRMNKLCLQARKDECRSSTKLSERLILQELINETEKNEVLVVYSLLVLFHPNLDDFVNFTNNLHKKGITIYCIKEKLFTNTAHDRFFFLMSYLHLLHQYTKPRKIYKKHKIQKIFDLLNEDEDSEHYKKQYLLASKVLNSFKEPQSCFSDISDKLDMRNRDLSNKKYSCNCLAYIRVADYIDASTGNSLKDQKRRLEDWCMINGFNIIKIIQDDGIEANNLEFLTNLNSLLNSLKVKDTIIVTDLSRIARTKDVYLQVCNTIIDSSARLISLTENIIISDKETRIKAQRYIDLIEIGIDQLSETTRNDVKYVKQVDKVTKLSYGMQRTDTVVSQNQEERKIIDLIVTLSLRSNEKGKPYTPYTIACKLNEFNIKPPGKSKQWYDMSVKRILERETKKNVVYVASNDQGNVKEEIRIEKPESKQIENIPGITRQEGFNFF